MNRFTNQWQKLVALARQAADDRAAAAPYGFGPRVAAQAAALPPAGLTAVFERLALRGLVVAAAFSVAAIAFGLFSFRSEPSAADAATDDSVGEVLDLS